MNNRCLVISLALTLCAFLSFSALAQETTGGLQGVVKDPTGAVIPHAQVEVTGSTLVGSKKIDTDGSGYYRFTNLPPGTYTLTVTAKGFRTLKREGIGIEVGHLPSVDLALEVGAASEVVEVSSAAPSIDTTTNVTQTNITSDVLAQVPTGRSFQSVIQFAPSARNEPLAGNNNFYGAGTGGSSVSSSSNGQAYGYSVGGAADSENSYLVEGQDTSNIAAGYSQANVPFDFIQEVQVKSSGIEAEHGGALGGVVNVVMKKGGNAYHGQLIGTYESEKFDAAPNPYPRYDPASGGNSALQLDAAGQNYQPVKDHNRILQLGGNVGGAILKDRAWFFLGFEPQLNSFRRNVNFGGTFGETPFPQSLNTFYTTARVDVALTKKINIFGSWLYQYARETGSILPHADSTAGLVNVDAGSPITNFLSGTGFTAPNQTFNVGGDISINPRLISTTRFGYFVQDYHDFGFPIGFPAFSFQNSGLGAPINSPVGCNPDPAATTNQCATIASTSPLSQANGYNSANVNFNFTPYNLNKHYQFDQDLAWIKSGWWGTHNFKFGYQLNHLYNLTLQRSNLPEVFVFPGLSNGGYSPNSSTGVANCTAIEAATQQPGNCNGTDGYVYIYDTGTDGKAGNYNHGLFAQDSWTVGKGVTLNLGIRFDKEYLPAYKLFEGLTPRPINFSWSDKIAPRIGAAWDVFKNGKMKVFGSYGVYYDTMKLNLAISSFGGQYWNNCAYALNSSASDALSQIDASYGASGNYAPGRSCAGLDPTKGGSFSSGKTPADLTFIENSNNRTPEYVIPNIKPYRQHDATFGVDYQLTRTVALEARWDRRRLDRAIEDAAVFHPTLGESAYLIVNPGFAPNNTFNNYAAADFALNDPLYGCLTPGSCPTGANGALSSALPQVVCATCPAPPKAVRSYDGVEIRATMTGSKYFVGMISYTYSNLRGNYSGLTGTDISDSSSLYGGGRASPNNSRYFDEPWFSYTANGTVENGPLATDRPNVFKGYGYYRLAEGKSNSTNFGLFQYLYQGSPLTSYVDVGAYYGGIAGQFDQYIVGRGNWISATQAPGGGPITVTGVSARRTPWYIQSDFQLQHEVKLGGSEATKSLRFEATVPNILNQKSVTAYVSQLDSAQNASYIRPGGFRAGAGAPFFAAAMHPYDWRTALNTSGRGVILNSNYGKPVFYQLGRTIRLGVRFTF